MGPAEPPRLFSLTAALNQNAMAPQVARQLGWLPASSSLLPIIPAGTLPLVGSRLKAEISEHVKPANRPVSLLCIYSPRPHPPKIIRGAARRQEPGWPMACSTHSPDLLCGLRLWNNWQVIDSSPRSTMWTDRKTYLGKLWPLQQLIYVRHRNWISQQINQSRDMHHFENTTNNSYIDMQPVRVKSFCLVGSTFARSEF